MANNTQLGLVFFLLILSIQSTAADPLLREDPLYHHSLPFIGAQVFIEPGQTKEEIQSWFRIMSEHSLSACRIRMFESYMRDVDYNWDFELFDIAFKAAEKYGIRIWATLYPVTGGTPDRKFLPPAAIFAKRSQTEFRETDGQVSGATPQGADENDSIRGWADYNSCEQR